MTSRTTSYEVVAPATTSDDVRPVRRPPRTTPGQARGPAKPTPQRSSSRVTQYSVSGVGGVVNRAFGR
ncbi:hypothetical protein SAMN04488570_0434 [Nocardioides scoriae]|uniref:Uncharacterized protein n=1 Tax=Nocardioides scoriae TaxID=642780 RepID=A0A1H1M0V8_9ACTN|nr:hypothetical protein SAMN04488570_0434 [Nocardioides scoriae]